MNDFINSIKADHSWTPARPQTESLIDEIEKNRKCALPVEMKEFYRVFDQVALFESQCYRFLALTEIAPVGLLQAGEDGQGWCSPSWLAFCDMWDCNYVSLDTKTSYILDCDHEQLGECTIIAQSFAEFVDRALHSKGNPYWLSNDFSSYGVVTWEPVAEFYRRLDADWWSSLGSEIGPELCKADGCPQKRIELSVMCRRHHYEMVMRRLCPFDD